MRLGLSICFYLYSVFIILLIKLLTLKFCFLLYLYLYIYNSLVCMFTTRLVYGKKQYVSSLKVWISSEIHQLKFILKLTINTVFPPYSSCVTMGTYLMYLKDVNILLSRIGSENCKIKNLVLHFGKHVNCTLQAVRHYPKVAKTKPKINKSILFTLKMHSNISSYNTT